MWYNIETEFILKSRLDTYDPPIVESPHWKEWIAHIKPTTCSACLNQNGKIYAMNDVNIIEPPLHPNCGCEILPMKAVVAGNGTKDGKDGADWWMKYMGKLPDYYISQKDLENLGWRLGKRPAKYAPRKMATMGIYKNKDKHLPDSPNRIWHEADINYYEGRRNRHRLVWSNDGLIFLTYDHYETFYEVI